MAKSTSWKITDMSYVSLATPNIEATISDFKNIFGMEEVATMSVSRAYGWLRTVMGNGSECYQELLQPTTDTQALGRFVRDRGGAVYVTSYVVDDLAACYRDLKAKGVRFATGPEDARAERANAVWIHPRATTGVYVELANHLLVRNAPAPVGAKTEPLIKNVSYIGAVVRDLKAATDLYAKVLNFEVVNGPFDNKEYKYNGVMMGNDGRGYIELQQPYDEESTMGRFLKNRGEAPYFASFVCDDVKKAVDKIKERGGNAFVDANGRTGWVHPKTAHGEMMELTDHYLPGN